MKKLFTTFILALGLCGCIFAQNSNEEDLDLQYAGELLVKGTQAPDFSLDDIEGRNVRLSDFKGRKVVLNFWASWCPDCREEVPELKAMMAAADPSEVAFVSVSFDRSFDAFKTYVRENYIGGVQLFDAAGKKDSSIASAYHVRWIPSLYLIDEDGKIVLGTVVAAKIARAIGATREKSVLSKGVCTEEGCE